MLAYGGGCSTGHCPMCSGPGSMLWTRTDWINGPNVFSPRASSVGRGQRDQKIFGAAGRPYSWDEGILERVY